MKLHFEPNLDYQKQAIESVADLFRGQEINRTEFTVTRRLSQTGDRLTLTLVLSSARRESWGLSRVNSASATDSCFLMRRLQKILETFSFEMVLPRRVR